MSTPSSITRDKYGSILYPRTREVKVQDSPSFSPQTTHAGGAYVQLRVGRNGLATSEMDYYAVEGRHEWSAIFKALELKGIRSVMVEGGASVINSLLAQPELVDAVVVTVAPIELGEGGVRVSPPHPAEGQVGVPHLKDPRSRQFGQDTVVCGKLDGVS